MKMCRIMKRILLLLFLCFLAAAGEETSGERASVEADKCPDHCSRHGVCIANGSNPYCVCDDGWGGVACADVRYDLSADEPISITIRNKQIVYCNITTQVPPFNNLTVYLQSFSKLPAVSTPSLYVGRDYYPDADNNEYNDITTARQKSITVLDPQAGNWYVALVGRDSPSLILTIQVNMDDVCFSNCSSNGKCQPPDDKGYVKCLCNYGYQGEYCEEYMPVMRNATPYMGHVDHGLWNYWHFNITVEPTKGMYLLLSVGGAANMQNLPVQCTNDFSHWTVFSSNPLLLIFGSSNVELYTQINGRPTETQYVCHQPNTSSSTVSYIEGDTYLYTCVVSDTSMLGKGNAWYIGVLGTKLSEVSGNYTVMASLHLSGTPPLLLPSPLHEKNIVSMNKKWKQRRVL